jgi:hypothetical protein
LLLTTLVALGLPAFPGGPRLDQSLLRLGCRQTVVEHTISKPNALDLLTFFLQMSLNSEPTSGLEPLT